jgi:hypothetical protein
VILPGAQELVPTRLTRTTQIELNVLKELKKKKKERKRKLKGAMKNDQKNKTPEWVLALYLMKTKDYWSKANTVEFFAFVIKAVIIVPGLLFDTQIWWLYALALISSAALVWSSTVKTIPTLIWFNILWICLASAALVRNFL